MVHQRQAAEQAGAHAPLESQHQLAHGRLGPRGYMGFTSFQVVAVGVVHGMAALPGEVRHQQQAVKHKPHHGLDTAVGMESMMAALMGDHPAAIGHGAGDQSVEQPERGCGWYEGDRGAESVGQYGEAQ